MEVQNTTYSISDVSTNQCIDGDFLKGVTLLIAQRFGKKLSGTPIVIERQTEPSGITVFAISNEDHVVITSYKFNQMVVISLSSKLAKSIDLTSTFSAYFSVSSSNIKKYSVTEQKAEYEECQEPRCRYPAKYTWGGMKVCQDHYEQYKSKELEDLDAMDQYR